jgi:hypothetical protein
MLLPCHTYNFIEILVSCRYDLHNETSQNDLTEPIYSSDPQLKKLHRDDWVYKISKIISVTFLNFCAKDCNLTTFTD